MDMAEEEGSRVGLLMGVRRDVCWFDLNFGHLRGVLKEKRVWLSIGEKTNPSTIGYAGSSREHRHLTCNINRMAFLRGFISTRRIDGTQFLIWAFNM